jgi:hypothetical protein
MIALDDGMNCGLGGIITKRLILFSEPNVPQQTFNRPINIYFNVFLRDVEQIIYILLNFFKTFPPQLANLVI